MCNSIGELVQIEMELYPNPNSGRFSLYWNAETTPEITNILVHDIQGRAVAIETTRLGDRIEIQLNQVVAGTYTVGLLLNNTPWNKTFILTE